MLQLLNRSRSFVWTACILLVLGVVTFGLWFIAFRQHLDLVAHGRAAYATGDWSRAADLARTRLRAAPTDPEALRLLARASARLGRDSSANALFERLGSTALRSEDLYLLGLGLNRSGQSARAERVWERALALDAHHPELLEQLALLYTARNRLAEAAVLADRLSTRPGWQLRGELLLGSLRSELNDPAGTAKVLRQALERPEASGLSNELASKYQKLLGRTLIQTSKPDEARALLRKYLDRGPDEEASWLLSRAELAMGAVALASDALEAAGAYRRFHPLESEPGPFAGAARCALCHGEIFEAQQASRHASTLLWGQELAELPLPDQSIPDPDDPTVSHVFRREGGRIRIETHTNDAVKKAVVEYAVGSRDHYASLVGVDEYGTPHILRLSRYQSGRDSGWLRTTGHSADAGGGRDLLGKPLDPIGGIHRCLFCHSTNPTAVLSRSGPESIDHGIGCERCHGPGELHLKAVGTKFRDRAIIDPRHATAEGRLRLCGQCHSYHGELSLPRDDPFWIRFQGTTLPWSRCYTESRDTLDCTTCHDPHQNNDLKPADSAAKCLKCHRPIGEPPAVAESSAVRSSAKQSGSPCPVNSTRGCVGCHMPPFRSEPLHATFTDHYIRVHRQANDQKREPIPRSSKNPSRNQIIPKKPASPAATRS
jgi:tetratricopeptide (TPR) repeat protein